MKNLHLLLVVMFISTFVNAQIKKDAILIGGNLGQYNNTFQAGNNESRGNYSLINIAVGKAIKENKVLGLSSSFSFNSYKNRYTGFDTSTTKMYSFKLGVFYRQYKKLAKDFYVFGGAEAGYAYGYTNDKYRSYSGEVRTRTNGGYASFGLGFAYQLFKKMQLELNMPSIGYIEYGTTKRTSTASPFGPYNSNNFVFNSNLSNNSFLNSMQIGFRFIL